MNVLGSPIAWLAASLAAYAAATNAAWHLVETAPRRLPPPIARRALSWAYLAGVPALALALRVPESPAQLGLVLPARPAAAAVLAVAVGALAALLVRGAAWEGPLAAAAGRRAPGDARAIAEAVAAAAGHALHASFVRSAVLSAGIGLGAGPTGGAPAMLATLALLAIEALLDPWTRHAVLAPGRPPAHRVRSAAMAAADAAAFALTGSLIGTITARLAGHGAWAVAGPEDALEAAADAPERRVIEPTVL